MVVLTTAAGGLDAFSKDKILGRQGVDSPGVRGRGTGGTITGWSSTGFSSGPTVNTGNPGYNASVALGTDGSLWSWGAYYAGWTGATGLGPEGGRATASRMPRIPPACWVATLGGDVWFASLC